MNKNDLLTIGTVALGTATLTVAALFPGPMQADGDGATLPAKIAQPKLVCHGAEMSLAPAADQVFKAGEEPIFELTAVNTRAEAATVNVRIAMFSSSPADALSRVVRLPASLWQEPQSLVLKPRETRVLTISSRTKLPPKAMISVVMENVDAPGRNAAQRDSQALSALRPLADGQSSIVAMTFSTAAAAAQPVLASANQ